MYDSDFARHHDIFFRTLSVEKFTKNIKNKSY